jgi:hypothetical protein
VASLLTIWTSCDPQSLKEGSIHFQSNSLLVAKGAIRFEGTVEFSHLDDCRCQAITLIDLKFRGGRPNECKAIYRQLTLGYK